MYNMRAIILLCALVLAVMAQNSNLIQNLPGLQSTPNFRMYSGYISVSSSKQLFYWFVESVNAPSTDPLILWLNGGPGCSSLGGLLSENGPFSPDNSSNLVPNPYSWNNVANVLYLESPAGVGFSIFNPTGISGDNSTADDSFRFLQKWFALYPKYQNNDFYIAGESYGGHYIPTLAYRIAMAAQTSPFNFPQKNFRGFLVGNPLINYYLDLGAPLNLYYQYHGMLQLGDTNGNPAGNLDPYDILIDVCNADSLRNRIRFPHPLFKDAPKKRSVPNPPACIDDYVSTYLNRADVQSAIHAKKTSWALCGGIDYAQGDALNSMIPYFDFFLNSTQYKVLVYSGDADTVLSFVGTQTWIMGLGRSIQSPWNAWTYNNENGQQVAGWYVVFDRMTFATIKGAGHMVPWFQPGPALQMLNNFLSNTF
jgi:carboxypeptidase C (cathepsin A)